MPRFAELSDLAALSARIGRNPLLAQASSGNTSIKLEDRLWIKASGKWLAAAMDDDDTFVPVPMREARNAGCRASVETATHAVLPQRVVIHVHSVNAISWAVRQDGPEQLASRLDGLPWHWIPYVSSGEPLAEAVATAISRVPALRVFVLANHGLIVCGDDCAEAEALLLDVERRVAIPIRGGEGCDDAVSRQILAGGVLYPCQVIFLGTDTSKFSSPSLTVTQKAVLDGLREVVRRVEETAPIRYLSGDEIAELVQQDVHGYVARTESNCR
jgi:ribulose-5-phosphate 4-epimerase/fuculose-1-phosphate aldolase